MTVNDIKQADARNLTAENKFPLLRRLSISSLVAMLITAVVLILLFRQGQISEHQNIATLENEQTLTFLTSQLGEQISVFIAATKGLDTNALRASPGVDSLRVQMEKFSEKPWLKIKIYDLSGNAIFSTAKGEIGKPSKHPDWMGKALLGEVITHLEHRDLFLSTFVEIHDAYISSTYMPLNYSGHQIGVFEIYRDYSPFLDSIYNQTIQLVFAVLIAFSALYATMFFYVRRTDRDVVRWREIVASSEDSLRRAQRIAGLGSFVQDLRTGLLETSNIADQLFGVDDTYEHSVNGWSLLVHPDDRSMMLSYISDEVIGQRKNFDKDYRIIRHSDQVVRWVHGLGVLEFDAQGLPVKMRGTVQDITERKLAEELLTLNKIIIEKARDGFYRHDLEGYLLEVNQSYAKMMGYKRNELIGMRISQVSVNTNTPELLMERMAHLIRQGATSFETRHRRKDGRLIDFDVSAIYLPESKCIYAFLRDITEHKKTEEALRVAAVAFETHEAIVITDANSNIVRVNHAFSEITGYSAAEVLGQNPRMMRSGRHDRNFYIEMWQQLLHTGAWSGEIWDRRKNGETYPKWMSITCVKNAQHEISHYVAVFSDITARKLAEDEIRMLAFYDVLTKLPNRRLLLDRFNAALAASARYNNFGAVLFIDMDKFKTLNDTLGHDCGDLMLVEVAARIKSCVREMDTVARFGGDEFVVLIESVSEDQDDASYKVGLIAEKLRETLTLPYLLGQHEHHSSPSIGVSLYRGSLESVDTLLQHADLAMYQAKNSGRNAVRFFDMSMQKNVDTRNALLSDLRDALTHHQLQLLYQIQVDNDNRPVGAEALLRWNHPQRGMVMPDQFIPVAEENGLMTEIGNWVLEEACRQLGLWGQNEAMRDLTLAVNISAKQFAMPDFVRKVNATLKTYLVSPPLLKLELTEGMALDDLPGTVVKMHELKAIGVSLSMDDFGTRYSSLSYLRQLPLDQLKLDKGFVQAITRNESDAQLVKNIIDLTNDYRLKVIAEGVETDAQLTMLKHRDCIAFQGFLFSKAVPIEEFEKLLDELRK